MADLIFTYICHTSVISHNDTLTSTLHKLPTIEQKLYVSVLALRYGYHQIFMHKVNITQISTTGQKSNYPPGNHHASHL